MRAVILDGHNDLVLRGSGAARRRGTSTSARAAEAGFAGGFFALFVPGRPARSEPEPRAVRAAARGRRSRATRRDASPTSSRPCSRASTSRSCAASATSSRAASTAIMHLEGAEPLAPDLSDLERWYDRGLRSLGIVWSRRERVRRGRPVPLPGLARHRARADRRRAATSSAPATGSAILVDVSHLNEAGFWDVARTSHAPLVATHSNAHALCASSRNLTDEQLDAIGRSGGVVGVNFARRFLREDGRNDAATPLGEIVRHVDYIAARIGVDHVAFGSDFEGAVVPDELGGVAGLPRLVEALARARLRRRGAREDHARQLAARARRDVAPVGPLLRPRGRRPAPDAARRRSSGFAAAGPRRRPRRRHRPRHGRAAAARLERGRDRPRAGGDRRACSRSSAGPTRRGSRRASRRFEDATWPDCDLVNASFSLPVLPRPSRSTRLWGRIVDSLRPGGRFCGQLFGERDEWAGSGIVVHTRAEVDELLDAVRGRAPARSSTARARR